MVELTETLVKAISLNKDAVEVREMTTDEEDTILLQVLVDESDMGRVIGKGGQMIKAIRTLVQASSSIKEKKKVRIELDEIK